jgi:hypothetical protein
MSPSRDTKNEIESSISIQELDNRQLKEELKQLRINLNIDPRSLNGIYDRRELEKLLISYRLRYKQMIENEKRVQDRRRAEEARIIQREVKILDQIKSYQEIVNELRYYKVDFDPLDDRKNLITTLALARLGLLENENEQLDASASSSSTTATSASSSTSWNPFGSGGGGSSNYNNNNNTRSTGSSAPLEPPSKMKIPNLKLPKVKLDFPGSVLSQLANVTSLFEVDREVEKLKKRHRDIAREKKTIADIDSEYYTEVDFGTDTNHKPSTSSSSIEIESVSDINVSDEEEGILSDINTDIVDSSSDNDSMFKWKTSSSSNDSDSDSDSSSTTVDLTISSSSSEPRRRPPGKKLRPVHSSQSSPASPSSYTTSARKRTRLEREEIASVDSIKFASELIMKSFLGPVLLAAQSVLKPYLPRVLSWEGPQRAVQFLRVTILSVIMRLAVWATGDKHTASLLLFSTTVLCVVARKGIIWFVLSFLMVRTVRLALFSGGIDWLINSDASDKEKDKDKDSDKDRLVT